MKTFVLALVAAVLVAAQVLAPVSAAPAAANTCGDTYTVVRGDYLSKIARTCGVSLATIINANPEIRNFNLIYPGQVIRLVADSSIPVTGGTTYTVVRGDTLSNIAVRFGTSVAELLRLNPSITNASRIFVGQVIYLPGSGGGTGGTYGRSVTLSSYSVKANGSVTVYVTGFPANAAIDLRIGKQGSAYTSVYDSSTNASGAATNTVTIPSSAVSGEKWVIVAQTTDIANGVERTSSAITIIP